MQETNSVAGLASASMNFVAAINVSIAWTDQMKKIAVSIVNAVDAVAFCFTGEEKRHSKLLVYENVSLILQSAVRIFVSLFFVFI